jgi:hypothetical protein
VNESDSKTATDSCQTRGHRVILAATLFAQGARLLHEESFDLLNISHAARLRVISDGVQRLVPALRRLGRATTASQFAPVGEVSSREAML